MEREKLICHIKSTSMKPDAIWPRQYELSYFNRVFLQIILPFIYSSKSQVVTDSAMCHITILNEQAMESNISWKTANTRNGATLWITSPAAKVQDAICNNEVTSSMEHNPSWEANRFWAGQEIPRILSNSKIHFRIHQRPPPVPILTHSHPVHASPSHSRSILILSSHLHLGLPSGLHITA